MEEGGTHAGGGICTGPPVQQWQELEGEWLCVPEKKSRVQTLRLRGPSHRVTARKRPDRRVQAQHGGVLKNHLGSFLVMQDDPTGLGTP